MPDPQEETLRIHCPAKLNLTLAVAPPRADGLHPIASVMLPLAFGDTLKLHRLDGGSSRFERVVSEGCPKPIQIDWPIEKDLVIRAHALLEEHVCKALPIACELAKAIPTGAGLGGGSANAAGMLVGLRKLFTLDISDDDLLSLGQSLGADVGFAVHAVLTDRAALVTGIGEVIEPIASLAGAEVVLVFPQGACPTGAVYAAFDAGAECKTMGDDLKRLSDVWRAADALPEPMNDLAGAAIRVCPAIGLAIDGLASLGIAAHLTGSGSALFVLAETPSQAQAIAQAAQSLGLSAHRTRFTPPPALS